MRHVLLTAMALVLAAASSCSCGPVKPGADGGAGIDASVKDAGDVDAGLGTPVDSGVMTSVDAGLPPELKIARILPPRAPSAGGVNVLVEGSGFLHNFAGSGTQAKPLTALKFGSNTVIDFQIIDDQTLEARVPPGTTGSASVSLQNPNGRIVCNNCFTYFDELVVTGFSPKFGPLAGGNEVSITGTGFTSDVQVLFGGRSSPSITLVSPTQLKVIAPEGANADVVDLWVYNKNGTSTQRRAYRYTNNVRVANLAPLTGPLAGGTVVTLSGSGFTGATEVAFGATAGTALTVVSDSQLTVTTPPASAGAVSVTVTTPQGVWAVRDGFTYFDAAGTFAVFGVFPHVVRAGDVITVTGQGLDAAVLTASIGGVAAMVGTKTFSTVTLNVPMRGAAPRRSDLLINSATLPAALTWAIDLFSLTPASGPAVGGTAVTLGGAAFPSDAEVFIGSQAARASMVTAQSTVTATTPPGSGGAPSNVRVREAADHENETTLPGAFTFLEALAIGRVQPDRGAIAGNTLVTVLGAGFGDSTVIVFAANRAKDVKIVDSHTLTCRTPTGDVGTVNVRAERLTQSDTLPGGFSYFDPRSISGGASGGPLVGTLNVTVLDSTRGNYGAPVAQANVQLGLDSATPFQGITDARGQVTFSDPSLVKAQTVTVYKDLFESVTVTQVGSENLTVFIARTGGGGGGSAAGGGGNPASSIAGRVTGFKAPRALASNESLEARVFVAQTSLFGGAPFGGFSTRAGEKWQLVSDGAAYLVSTGAGLHAVYAVLGIVNNSSKTFTPVTMGVKRGVTTSPDVPATGEDIVLNMQLDLTVPIIIDTPLTFPDQLGFEVPADNKVYAWLDLGAEGFIPNPNNWSTGKGFTSSVESNGAKLSFPNFPQLDGSNFVFLNEATATTRYPVSYYFRRQPGPMNRGVTIGPLLPAPRLAPLTNFNGTLSWSLAAGAVPDLFNIQLVRQSAAGSVTVWEMVLPGTETSVVLPPSAVTKLKTEEAGNMLAIVMYGSRSPKFSYNQWTYDSLSGVSWSSFTLTVTDAFMIPQ